MGCEGVRRRSSTHLWAKEEGIADEEIKERLTKAANTQFEEKQEKLGKELTQQLEKAVVMQSLDHLWREHLLHLDHLRGVVGLRGYAQKDPLNEFKSESFQLFEAMLNHLREMVTQHLALLEIAPAEPQLPQMTASHINPMTGEDEFVQVREPKNPESWGRVSRNEPCPCGSGKKFKHCHGAVV
jgi:preprotein translocase subunit SecA